jgi:GGDEF domain-containing protein
MFGHPVGDALLKQVAARLTSLSPRDDLVVRMGGDEFVVVDSATRSRNEAAEFAQRILDTISAPYIVAGHDIIIGVSIGVAVSPDDEDFCPDALLSHADKALYQARSAAAVMFSPTTCRTHARHSKSWPRASHPSAPARFRRRPELDAIAHCCEPARPKAPTICGAIRSLWSNLRRLR